MWNSGIDVFSKCPLSIGATYDTYILSWFTIAVSARGLRMFLGGGSHKSTSNVLWWYVTDTCHILGHMFSAIQTIIVYVHLTIAVE